MMRTVFCDKCGFDVTETEIEELCPYWECDGAAALKIRNTGDALGQILHDALHPEKPQDDTHGDRAQEG